MRRNRRVRAEESHSSPARAAASARPPRWRSPQAGYDVAITARTVQEGEAREHSSTLKASDTSPLPGSLASTAALVRRARGARR